MLKKTEQVKQLINAGDLKGALAIAKTFKLGLSKDEVATINRGYECLVRPAFYKQMGKNIEECVAAARVIVEVKWA